MVRVVERVASFDWELAEIRDLLMDVAAGQAEELGLRESLHGLAEAG
jgi:hypothetical protein